MIVWDSLREWTWGGILHGDAAFNFWGAKNWKIPDLFRTFGFSLAVTTKSLASSFNSLFLASWDLVKDCWHRIFSSNAKIRLRGANVPFHYLLTGVIKHQRKKIAFICQLSLDNCWCPCLIFHAIKISRSLWRERWHLFPRERKLHINKCLYVYCSREKM